MKSIRLNLILLSLALCNLASDNADATPRDGPSSVVRDTTDIPIVEDRRPPPDSRLPLRVSEIGEDYILGRSRDDLGVEYVHLWALSRADPASPRDGRPVR